MKELLEEMYQFTLDDSHKNDDMLDALAHCFNPEMAQPGGYRRTVPTRVQEVGRPLFRVGQNNGGAFDSQSDKFAPLWKRLDRRVGDEIAA